MESNILHTISILYVEDERGTREVYGEQLSTVVKEVITAKNGEEGYKLYKEKKPDIIITDIMMPVMSGIDMAKKIREDNKYIPIVITSSSNNNRHLTKTVDIGIHGYMAKPINFNELLDLISNIAEILKLEDEKKMHEQILHDRFNMQRLLV